MEEVTGIGDGLGRGPGSTEVGRKLLVDRSTSWHSGSTAPSAR